MNNLVWKSVGLVLVAFLAAGCGPGGPRLYKAVGTVNYNGKPVEGATVTFVYDNGNSAAGTTDKAGKFELVYLGATTSGAAAGKCTAMVSKTSGGSNAGTMSKPAPLDPSNPGALQKSVGDAKTNMEKNLNAEPVKFELPSKYGNPATSGLTYEILPNNDNNFTIDLKD